jgi:hypothetical protein
VRARNAFMAVLLPQQGRSRSPRFADRRRGATAVGTRARRGTKQNIVPRGDSDRLEVDTDLMARWRGLAPRHVSRSTALPRPSRS